jgi:hypothetical protein
MPGPLSGYSVIELASVCHSRRSVPECSPRLNGTRRPARARRQTRWANVSRWLSMHLLTNLVLDLHVMKHRISAFALRLP